MAASKIMEPFGFTDNPFAETPPFINFASVWADRKEIRSDIEKQILFSLQTSPSKIILNWGDIGTGKTHAAKFFCNPKVLEKLCEEEKIPIEPLSLLISLPEARPRQVLNDLYMDFLNKLGFDNLQKRIIETFNKISPEKDVFQRRRELGGMLSNLGFSKDIATLFQRLTVHGGRSEERYLFMQATAQDIRKMDLIKGIESPRDILNTMSNIMNFLTNTRFPKPAYSKVFIWLDESEKIGEYSGADVTMFRGFLRDIVDYVPNNLTIFINYTLSPGERFDDIASNIGYMVWDRVGKFIFLGPMTEKQALEYTIELMNKKRYRAKDFKVPDEYYPFTPEALKTIIKEIKTTPKIITPRAVSKVCTEILQLYIRQRQPKKIGERITKGFLMKNEDVLFPKKKGLRPSSQGTHRSLMEST